MSQVRNENTSLQEKLEGKTSQMSKLEKEVSSLKEKLEKETTMRVEAEVAHETVNSTLRQDQSTLEKLSAEWEAAHERVALLEGEIDQLKPELQKQKDDNKALQSKCKKLSQGAKSGKVSEQKLLEMQDEMMIQNHNHEQIQKSLLTKLESMASKHNSAEDRVVELETEIRLLKESSLNATSEGVEVESLSEYKKSEEKISELEKTLELQSSKIQDLMIENEKAEQRAIELGDAFNDSENTKNTLEEGLSEAMAEIKHLQSEKDKVSELSRENEELQVMREELEILQQKNKKLQTDFDKVRIEKIEVDDHILQLKNEIQGQENQLESYRQSSLKHELDLDMVVNEKEELEGTMVAFQHQIMKLKNDLEFKETAYQEAIEDKKNEEQIVIKLQHEVIKLKDAVATKKDDKNLERELASQNNLISNLQNELQVANDNVGNSKERVQSLEVELEAQRKAFNEAKIVLEKKLNDVEKTYSKKLEEYEKNKDESFELQSTVESLEKYLADANQKISKYAKKMRSLEKENSSQADTIKNLETDLNVCEEKVSKYADEAELLEKEKLDLLNNVQQVDKLHEELTIWKESAAESQSKIANLEKELKKARDFEVESTSSTSELESELEGARNKIAQHEKDISSMREELEAKCSCVNELQTKVKSVKKSYEREMKKARKSLKEYQNEVTKLKKDSTSQADLRNELNEARETIASHEAEVMSLRNEISSQSNMLNELHGKLEANAKTAVEEQQLLSERSSMLQEDIIYLREENQSLKVSLEEKRKLSDKLSKAEASLKAELAKNQTTKQREESMNVQKMNMEAKTLVLQKELDMMNKILATGKTERASILKELKFAKEENRSTREKLESVLRQKDTRKQKMLVLEGEIQRLRIDLQNQGQGRQNFEHELSQALRDKEMSEAKVLELRREIEVMERVVSGCLKEKYSNTNHVDLRYHGTEVRDEADNYNVRQEPLSSSFRTQRTQNIPRETFDVMNHLTSKEINHFNQNNDIVSTRAETPIISHLRSHGEERDAAGALALNYNTTLIKPISVYGPECDESSTEIRDFSQKKKDFDDIQVTCSFEGDVVYQNDAATMSVNDPAMKTPVAVMPTRTSRLDDRKPVEKQSSSTIKPRVHVDTSKVQGEKDISFSGNNQHSQKQVQTKKPKLVEQSPRNINLFVKRLVSKNKRNKKTKRRNKRNSTPKSFQVVKAQEHPVKKSPPLLKERKEKVAGYIKQKKEEIVSAVKSSPKNSVIEKEQKEVIPVVDKRKSRSRSARSRRRNIVRHFVGQIEQRQQGEAVSNGKGNVSPTEDIDIPEEINILSPKSSGDFSEMEEIQHNSNSMFRKVQMKNNSLRNLRRSLSKSPANPDDNTTIISTLTPSIITTNDNLGHRRHLSRKIFHRISSSANNNLNSKSRDSASPQPSTYQDDSEVRSQTAKVTNERSFAEEKSRKLERLNRVVKRRKDMSINTDRASMRNEERAEQFHATPMNSSSPASNGSTNSPCPCPLWMNRYRYDKQVAEVKMRFSNITVNNNSRSQPNSPISCDASSQRKSLEDFMNKRKEQMVKHHYHA